MTPSGIAISSSSTKLTAPITKLSHTVLLNSSTTGIVHFQLSPKSPRSMLPSHPKKPGMMPLSRLYEPASCAIHSSKLLEPGCMDFCRAMFSM